MHLGISFNAESEFGIHFVSGSTVTTSFVLTSKTDFENKGRKCYKELKFSNFLFLTTSAALDLELQKVGTLML